MSTSAQPRPNGCRLALLALLAALLPAAPAAAQLSAGRIVGTVTDPSKAAIPHATVVVTDTATNVSVTVVTGDHGDYVVTPLNPGVYGAVPELERNRSRRMGFGDVADNLSRHLRANPDIAALEQIVGIDAVEEPRRAFEPMPCSRDELV